MGRNNLVTPSLPSASVNKISFTGAFHPSTSTVELLGGGQCLHLPVCRHVQIWIYWHIHCTPLQNISTSDIFRCEAKLQWVKHCIIIAVQTSFLTHMCALHKQSALHVHCSVVYTRYIRGHYLQVNSAVSVLKLELVYMRGASSLFSKITALRGFHNFTSYKNTLRHLTCNADYHDPSILFLQLLQITVLSMSVIEKMSDILGNKLFCFFWPELQQTGVD